MNQHWPTYSLGELTSDRPISYGVLKPGPRQIDGVPLIRITDIKDNHLDESNIYLITEGLSQEFKRSVLQGGEVLLSIQGTIGRVAICPQHLAGANISRTIALIAPDERVNREFLRYWLLSAQDTFPVGGATRDSLNIGDIRKLRCPAPPLSEQQRIVRLLDQAFERIAVTKTNAEKNLQNARALFESYVQALLERGQEGWETKSVGEVCTFKRGLTYAKTDEVDVSENVVLRAMNIDLATNRLDFSELKYIDNKVVVPDEKKVRSGSLMICMASGSKSHLGKVAIIEEDYGHAFGGFMGMLTPSTNVLPRYLFHVMTSGLYKNFIGSMSAGANINNLTFEKLSAFRFPIPPLTEQQHIVAMLDKIETSTSQLSAAYLAKSRAVESLGVSLLHQTFSGKLEAA